MFSYISIIFAVANVCVLFCFVFVRQTVGELLMDKEKQVMDSQNMAFTSELLQFFQMVKIKCFHYNFQTNLFCFNFNTRNMKDDSWVKVKYFWNFLYVCHFLGFKHDNDGKKVIVNHKEVQVSFDLKNHADFKLFSEIVFMKWQFEQVKYSSFFFKFCCFEF